MINFLVLLLAACALPALGEDYPSRPVRFIVPFTAGGGGDIIIREIGQKLSARLGQSVIMDNRAGAGGSLGTELAARSPPDGYTLLMANVAPMAINVKVTMYFGSMPAALPHIRSLRLRALGVTSLTRSAAAPDIPTVAESGFTGFEAVTWIGAVGPAGVPRNIVTRLNTELADIMRSPEVRDKMLAQGAEPMTDTPEHFGAYIKSEIGKWAGVVKLAGIAAQ